jgi:hypothetical protein
MRVVDTDGTAVVVPAQTNGYEAAIPDSVLADIEAHRVSDPKADKAPWAAVVAFRSAASGAAPNVGLELVALYQHAMEQYAGDVDLPTTAGRASFVRADGDGVADAADELRTELRTAWRDATEAGP